MIKTVLAQRFYLAIDREQKSRTVSALVVAEGGPKLRPAMGLSDPECGPGDQDGMIHLVATT
jgi:uncharacterized protein (TIGR03435 family)